MAHKRSRKDFETDLQRQESPFVLYGTPLPPIDEHSRDDGSYVPVWKQEVTDDRGRKRLHGAFTGGFSAGYFNTVGSKEGWAPSTFISSRTNRAKNAPNHAQQRPEDFMDEEDVREQEESRQVSANEAFAGFGTADDPNHQNALMDLLRPTEDTMGFKLLNRMGWKHGQGIGPKIRRKVDSSDDMSESHLFAPDDAPMLNLVKKSNPNGLGYIRGSDKMSMPKSDTAQRIRPDVQSDEEEGGRPGLSFASASIKKSKSKRGAFGVGILNDTGSDEEDPYSMGPQILYTRKLGGDKKSRKDKNAINRNANPTLKVTPVFIPKRLASTTNILRQCHDGRLPLSGFVLADELDGFSTMSLNDNKYKPPLVPDGWKSSRADTSDSASSTNTHQTTAELAKASMHTYSSRGSLLGESALPGKSVFDFLTPAAREKLMKATGRTNLPPALSEILPGSSPSTSTSELPSSQIPCLNTQTALQALARTLNGGFNPYPDAAKASRYKSYLESQANIPSDSSTATPHPAPRPPSMTKEDYLVELHEFARAAEVFKPVSGLMASRFTTSTASQPSSSPSTDHKTTDLSDLLSKPASQPKDPAEEAAAMGMFGHLTRSVGSFYPTRLLCKRFGVAMPTPMPASTDEMPSTTATSSASRFQGSGYGREDDDLDGSGLEFAHLQNSGLLAIEEPSAAVAIPESTKVEQLVVDPDKNEALEQERPGAAVFRAIFGSDEDDDDENED